MPDLALVHFGGELLTLSGIRSEWVVFYLYPGTDEPLLHDKSEGQAADIAQHKAFRESKQALASRGIKAVGVSSQTRSEQLETINANLIGHLMLSDTECALADALTLPTFQHADRRRYRRLTLLTTAGVIKWACYPVENPSGSPRQVLTWLHLNAPRGGAA